MGRVSLAADPTALGFKGQRETGWAIWLQLNCQCTPQTHQNTGLGGPGHMTSPACCVPRAGPGQWSPPPFPHQVCQGPVDPGQTSTDKRRTLVASGWQALPLDYRRGIILPFPALPLRVAPEHPGKPPRVSTALGRR